MIIIGEKINGFIPKTLAAINARDEDYIRFIAQGQKDGGANYLDICAGVAPEIERETMEWLMQIVQDAVDLPLCLDSSDPQVLLDMMPFAKRPGILNSVSLEEGKCEAILPAIADTEWCVVALTCDSTGLPGGPKAKFELASKIIGKANALGIASSRIFIDALVEGIATKEDSFLSFSEAIRLIKAEYPDVHFTSGLSNISFGMPYRKAINMQFLALSMAAGMDSAIMDPMSADMQATLHATNTLLGNDEYCMEYLQAYRGGLFDARPA
ncbi:MAG: dihydropteroate synthase [Coriobacteriales bacterium]|jgi:5-methyltetrahydrofolate--homocysteine methyltransferase|nr:dihydropteroate synthase [Coriobacteriales bacterium]